MASVTLKICFIWFSCVLTFSGLSLNSSKMNGNIFINNLVSAIAQFIACLKIAPYLSKKFGNQLSLSISFGICGLMLIITWILEYSIIKFKLEVHWFTISTIANLGRMFVCVVFAIIYPFSSKLFPTAARGSGISLASACARFGGISYGVLMVVSKFLESSWD